MLQTEQFNLSCDILSSHGLQGKLRPNANGQYQGIVLGALNFKNSYGAIYTVEGGQALVNPNSGFSRRQKEGHAKGEYGHPKRTDEFKSDEAWIQRIMAIEETRTCHDHNHTWIDTIKDKRNGQKVICFLGDLTPYGPYGDTLDRDLQRDGTNSAFSIRSITDDFRIGNIHTKNILDATGFDKVNEPGLSVATKFQMPGLESFAFQIDDLERIVADQATGNVSLEACNMIKQVIVSLENRVSTKSKIYTGNSPSLLIGA